MANMSKEVADTVRVEREKLGRVYGFLKSYVARRGKIVKPNIFYKMIVNANVSYNKKRR